MYRHDHQGPIPDIVPVAMHQQRPPQKLELSEGEVTGLGGGGALVTHDAQPDVGLLNHNHLLLSAVSSTSIISLEAWTHRYPRPQWQL